MARHQRQDDRVERLRAMWKAQGANAPQRATFRFTVEHCNPIAITAARRETKRHSDDQVIRIAESILAFGFTAPIIVDRDGRIIAGHACWMAARLLGLEEIPVVRRDDLSEDEARLLSLALNRLAERSEWDEAALGQELEHLLSVEHEMPFDVAITGFDAPEQDRYLASREASSQKEDDDNPDGPDLPACTRPGDLWLLDRHRVLCGDATLPESYLRLMAGEKAQTVIADAPYNVPVAGHVSSKAGRREFAMASGEMSRPQFTAFLQAVNTHLARHSRRASIHLLFMDHRHIVEMMTAGEAVYTRLLNLICWVKDNGGQGSLWRSRHELIFAWQNGTGKVINNVKLGASGRNRTNVWEAPGANTFRAGRQEELDAHPTPKPVSLLREAIKDVSHRGGIVLDPFLGGGATLIAAERTGRRCHGDRDRSGIRGRDGAALGACHGPGGGACRDRPDLLGDRDGAHGGSGRQRGSSAALTSACCGG